MKSVPLVSCIIIFLNAEKFIAEAIESVFAQTFEHWELLLVDDGSTDFSTKIAKRYEMQYPEKVRYLEHDKHKNRGMSASRNLGINHANGQYIAFLDADDIWLPSKLEQQVTILNTWPEAAMVYGRTLIWYSWTGNLADHQQDHTLDLGVQPNNLIEPPRLFFLLLQNKVQTPTTCNVMVRHNVFKEIGKFEESFRGMYEDQVFFAKIHLKAPVFVANECWAKYRQHSESSSPVHAKFKFIEYYSQRRPFLNWLQEYLSKEGIGKNTDIWKALQKELWPCRHPLLFRLKTFPWLYIERMKGLLSFLVRYIRTFSIAG